MALSHLKLDEQKKLLNLIQAQEYLARIVAGMAKKQGVTEKLKAFDLALLDIMLPGVDGFQLLEPIKARGICNGELYTVGMRISDGTFLGSYPGIEAVENPTDCSNHGAAFSVANNTTDLSKRADWGDERGASLRYYAKPYSFALGFRYLMDESTTPADADGLSLVPQDARKKVDTFLQETGFADYFSTGVYLAKPDTANGGKEFAYVVACSHSYHGVGQRAIGESAWSEIGNDDYENTQYKKKWYYEKLYFYVDDSGIIGIRWISPCEIVDTVTEDTMMLPYESIMEVFAQMMPVVYERNASLDYVRVLEYQVDRITLELQRVSEQNSIETGLLIPVWNFYGAFAWKYVGDMTSSDEMTEDFPWSFLSINAIDGSVIDVAQGY